MPIGKPCCLNRVVELVKSAARFAESAVLPLYAAFFVHHEDSVVHTSCRTSGHRPSGNSTGRNQCHDTLADREALRIFYADWRASRDIIWTLSKLPNDVSFAVCFNDSVVELIGNENITGRIERFFGYC